MFNYEAKEEDLRVFYGVETLNPSTVSEILPNAGKDEFRSVSIEDVENAQLDPDVEYDELARLIQGATSAITTAPSVSTLPSDLEDPLGLPRMVDQLVAKHAIESKSDPKLAQFLVSSKLFQPQQYLTTVHSDSSIDDLVRSLRYLERNIESQSSELKSVIDANFLKFAECKKAIDDVLIEFRRTKTAAQKERDNTKVFNPTRQHRRIGSTGASSNTTNNMNNNNVDTAISTDLDESLKNLITTTSLMIKPILDHKNKEVKLTKFIEFVSENKFFFDLPNKLVGHLSRHDHEQFIDDYNRYLSKKNEYLNGDETGGNASINFALSKTFKEVDNIISEYRKRIYKELLSIDHEAGGPRSTFRNATNAKFISLVDKLYQLNNEPSTSQQPIYEFLNIQLDGLKKEFKYQHSKFERKFGMMQRKLTDYLNSLTQHREGGSNIAFISEKFAGVEDSVKTMVSERLDGISSIADVADFESIVLSVFNTPDNLDISIINEAWLVLHNFVTYLDDLFLKKVSKFVNNYKHYSATEVDSGGSIRDSYIKFVVSVTTKLVSIFNDPSTPPSTNQLESSPSNYSSFLPNHSNSLSTIFYLSNVNKRVNHFLTRTGESVVVVGGSTSTNTNTVIKNLRSSSAVINQRIIEAVCAVWVNDCSQFYDLEGWDVQSEWAGKDAVKYTRAISIMECYEGYVLSKIASLVFSKREDSNNGDVYDDGDNDDEKLVESGIRIVSAHPSKRVLVSIEIQFMRSLNVLVDSILKRYSLESQSQTESTTSLYKVLAMNNFDQLGRVTYPGLLRKFDRLFSNNLSEQNLKLYADIDKAGLTILDDILAKEKNFIDSLVSKHFTNAPPVDLQVDGFIYNVLIHFVKLVHVIKPLSGAEIFISIINELQTYFLKVTLEHLRSMPHDENYLVIVGNLSVGIHFFLEVFQQSKSLQLNEYCLKLVEVLFHTIDEAGNPPYSDREFDTVLARNLKESENEFDCFF
ncbi:exocyst complex component Sec5p [[Candida] anglica]|uniref:Exocyst complex component SEC5 n=1 Tax=[Candida] anglica TaxID=148631 RepID=A0ABP0EHI4_9ASCO